MMVGLVIIGCFIVLMSIGSRGLTKSAEGRTLPPDELREERRRDCRGLVFGLLLVTCGTILGFIFGWNC